ncbi:SDR family oxidoreductase [Halobacteriovorax sp. DPLXC-1]|uniref:SDR family oxidoreductase n=1 Tax=Halobacteriovorax sp. DPLXC-1 TaxID=3110771 RepID=UPI002FF0806E
MIALTGASGQLGQLVIKNLLDKGVKPKSIVAIARSTDKLDEFAKKGVQVRYGDYEKPDSLRSALEGVEKLLLISSSEVGKRLSQHQNVIDIVRDSSVKYLAYTSILEADNSPLGLAEEHLATEKLINDLDIKTTILRNGWYSENYTMGIPTILEHSVVLGCAGEGRISSAPRNDYALAAANVLTDDGHAGKVYELAGDTSYNLSEFATLIGEQYGRDISYKNMTQSEYRDVLLQAGLPEVIADMLADSEIGASKGGLYSESKDLSRLIGRPTESMKETIKRIA